ncbi:hypothetical protein OG413_41020 [Streptomyces sp. NBC_01433]|uniref:hypothetical protein n=1 Tax=Streptomyces sp. NBC_01433 TaxID=2903864 RepID=UPI0022553F88|nr:hypothetical protein [Streptomyces sp. NBC_01433]MCX4681586.1 hypothetical protein [Streptomyces sp. NBC_01433]
MEQDPAAHLLQEVRTALRMDTGVLDANAAHGAVTQVWFDPYEAREAVRSWDRLVLADGSVLADEALAPRRTARATWWPALENAVRQVLCPQPMGLAPLLVLTGADGAPAQVAFALRDDWPQVTLRCLRREGLVVGRLKLLLSEVESLQDVIAEGASFDLGEVTDALRSVIDVGEPAVRGKLPDRPAAAPVGITDETWTEVPLGGEEALRAARQHLDDLLSQHDSTSHPEVIDQWMALAELTGEQVNPRAAVALYDQLGKDLREQLGRHHVRTLDAYEGIARWVGAQGRA